MNYKEMSEFEINKLVAEKQGLYILKNQCKDEHPDYSGVDVVDPGDNPDTSRYPVEYCDDPSDAWPIILENKISIISSNDGYYATDDVDSFLEPDGKAPWDKNPLRSAMEVYLMMGEG